MYPEGVAEGEAEVGVWQEGCMRAWERDEKWAWLEI